MTKTLTVANELLDKAKSLNDLFQHSTYALSAVLLEISESETWREAGYDSYAEYVQGDLGHSKTYASNFLRMGAWLKANNVDAQTLDVPYSRLLISIRANEDKGAEYVISAAQTLTESEMITSKAEKDFPNCEHKTHICKDCKQMV